MQAREPTSAETMQETEHLAACTGPQAPEREGPGLLPFKWIQLWASLVLKEISYSTSTQIKQN